MMTESISRPTLGEALYDRCKRDAADSFERSKKVFSQEALQALCDSEPLDQIKDAHKLMVVIEELVNDGLFIFSKTKEQRCWGLRTPDAAKHVKSLTRDERMVYCLIEEAQENGIWIRNLKSKTGIKDGKAMEKILNKLQNQKLVKNVKNIKAPMQKTYILFHLAPSDEITGGSFYDAGDVDDNMLDDMCNAIIFHVRQMSWFDERKRRPKRDSSPILIRDDPEPIEAGVLESRGRKKRKRDSNSTFESKDIEDAAPQRKRRAHRHSFDIETETAQEQAPFPAGHEYPTAASIYDWITSTGMIRAVKADALTIDEVQKLLNILVWDEKLENVNGGYRTVRGVKSKQLGDADDPDEEQARKRGNGFTEMPCGQCPVIDLCGTGGPVHADNCVYFERWLGREITV